MLIPVLDEIGNIDKLINQITAELGQDDSYVICFVDDGSTDGTAERLREHTAIDSHIHLIERTKNFRGSQRGSALYTAMCWGLDRTTCNVFVEMDGDLSHRPEELKLGIAPINRQIFDVAIASKYLPGSKITNRPLGRKLVSRICNYAVRRLVAGFVSDYSNGYRFYSRHAAQLLADTQIRYASPIYLTEVMAVWIRHNVQIYEFPTHYVGRNEGLSKLRFIDLIKSMFAIFEIAFRLHVTSFKPRATAAIEPVSHSAMH